MTNILLAGYLLLAMSVASAGTARAEMNHDAMKMKAHEHHKNHDPKEMKKRSMRWAPVALSKVGAMLDPELTFRNGEGKQVRLGDYFDKPLFVTFVFASCPYACPTINGALARAAREAAKKYGDNFRLLTISFDLERDSAEIMGRYGVVYRDEFAHWTFGIAEEGKVKSLTDAFGFAFQPHPTDTWEHINMVTAVAPGGLITSQIIGLKVPQPEFDTALESILDK